LRIFRKFDLFVKTIRRNLNKRPKKTKIMSNIRHAINTKSAHQENTLGPQNQKAKIDKKLNFWNKLPKN